MGGAERDGAERGGAGTDSPDAAANIHREWANRVAAEYRSAATTAQLLHGLIRCGMPDPLISAAMRIVRDELDHAGISREALIALGGDPGAVPDLTPDDLADPVDPAGPLATICMQVVRNFCLGETLAVPLFAAMRAGTDHPQIRPALDRILRDEANHRAFGWEALQALIEADPGVRPFVAARLPGWIHGFYLAYGAPRPPQPFSDAEQAAGLLPMPDYHRIYAEAMAGDILPRFAVLGIVPQGGIVPEGGA